MWINRAAWQEYVDSVRAQQAWIDASKLHVAALERTIVDLRTRIDELLTERATLLAHAHAGRATSDVVLMQFNALRGERDALLAKVAGVTFDSPKVGRDPVVYPPGIDFSDVGSPAPAVSSSPQVDAPLSNDDTLEPDDV
jgi:hypothetical protein